MTVKTRGLEARDQAVLSSHSGWTPAADRPDPVGLLQAQNRTREPDLVPVRHGRMMVSPFTFLPTLQDDRRHLLEHFEIVDMARKVVGVGSVGTRDFIVLLQGLDAHDPLFLQVKEATASVLEDDLAGARPGPSGDPVAISEYLGPTDAFDKSITDFSQRYDRPERAGLREVHRGRQVRAAGGSRGRMTAGSPSGIACGHRRWRSRAPDRRVAAVTPSFRACTRRATN